jgi:V/A-type H+-transporting ATPase subunit I
MAIEKMSLVHIVGNLSMLDAVLMKCCESELFHVEFPEGVTSGSGFSPLLENNPHADMLQMAIDVTNSLSLDMGYEDYSSLNMNEEQMEQYLEKVKQDVLELKNQKSELKNNLLNHQQALAQVEHLHGLDIRFCDIVSSKNATARFGRLPADSFMKLEYFANRNFFFFDFDHDEDYYWGFYYAPNVEIDEADRIFNSLYFERIDISEYAYETPQNAADALKIQIQVEEEALQRCRDQIDAYRSEHQETIREVYAKVKMLHDTFGYRRYAVTSRDRFVLEGFVPTKRVREFMNLFEDMEQVICEEQAIGKEHLRKDPPVQLRTNRFFRPFEMFVQMYGLPGYYDYNPTSFIGLIYVVLFGMMFGDFGQGICVILVGLWMWKFKKMMLGQVLTRCGIASMFFGLLYGSCFGFEGCFKPLFNAIGLGELFPLDVLNSQTSLMLLVLSLGIGVVIILAAIIINIIIGLKNKDYGKAIFSNNGVAGLVFYGGIIAAVLLLLALKINVLNPIFIIVVIVLPLLLMFFKEPLTERLKRRGKHKKGTGEKFKVADAVFEMIDILLSYCTNTLSFLRIGGFILSHAALMLVVMTFAHMAGTFGSPIVVVIGNIFVMALEGLIVGIQVLRLVYYETFSRFYESKGTAFSPLKVEYDKKEQKK